jgi:hypothetical protein
MPTLTITDAVTIHGPVDRIDDNVGVVLYGAALSRTLAAMTPDDALAAIGGESMNRTQAERADRLYRGAGEPWNIRPETRAEADADGVVCRVLTTGRGRRRGEWAVSTRLQFSPDALAILQALAARHDSLVLWARGATLEVAPG